MAVFLSIPNASLSSVSISGDKSEGFEVNYVGDALAFADHPDAKRHYYNQPFFSSAVVVHSMKERTLYMHAARHYLIDVMEITEDDTIRVYSLRGGKIMDIFNRLGQ